MSPSSQDQHTTCRSMHLVLFGDDISVTKIQSVCEANLPDCLKKESSFTTASQIDLSKINLLQLPCSQSCHFCSTIMMSISSSSRPLVLSLNPCLLSLKLCLLSKSEKRKQCLQRGMTLYFGNPTKKHEQQKCEINEHHEAEIVEHPGPEIVENNEFSNDSGYGSTLWQDSAVFDHRNDLDNLNNNSEELSQCCFYYGSIDSQTSSYLLRNKPTGTFLLRDSSDPRYLYSLSVKTDKGTTSIRILYSNGFFQFDSDERIRHKLPRFETVLALINFHVKATEEGGNKLWRWEQLSGCKSLKVVLIVPLKKSVPSLGHLARVQINKCMNNLECPKLSIDKLPVEFDCLEMLRKYPYQI